MFHKIKDVRALPELQLHIQFAEGVVKVYDIATLIAKMPMFSKLQQEEALYYGVKVDVGGYGIIWDDVLDLSCDELWDNGIQIQTPFDGLIAFADATELWELNESTLRKAIAYGKLIPGVDVCKFGKQWVISMRAMEREYGKATK